MFPWVSGTHTSVLCLVCSSTPSSRHPNLLHMFSSKYSRSNRERAQENIPRTSEVFFLVFLNSKSRFTAFLCSFAHMADNLWSVDGSPAATPHLLIFYHVRSVSGLESRYTGRLDFWSKLSEGQIRKRISKVCQSQFPDIFTCPPQIHIFALFLL